MNGMARKFPNSTQKYALIIFFATTIGKLNTKKYLTVVVFPLRLSDIGWEQPARPELRIYFLKIF
jgi:hypothetical protein